MTYVDITLIARSIRMSCVRDRTLCSLDRRGRSYIGQLAEDAGVDSRRVRWALYGEENCDEPRYAPERSLIALGLAIEVDVAGTTAFDITPHGREVVRIAHMLRPRGRKRYV